MEETVHSQPVNISAIYHKPRVYQDSSILGIRISRVVLVNMDFGIDIGTGTSVYKPTIRYQGLKGQTHPV